MNIALNYISDKQTKDKISVIPPADMIMKETDADKLKGWKRDLITYIDKLLYGDNVHTKEKETITDKVNKFVRDNPITVSWMGVPQVFKGIEAAKIAHDENTGLLGDLWHGAVGMVSGGVNRAFTPEADNIGAMFLGYKVSGEYLKYGERLAACNKRLKELLELQEHEHFENKSAYEKAIKDGVSYGMTEEQYKEFSKDRGKWYTDKLIEYYKKLKDSKDIDATADTIRPEFDSIFMGKDRGAVSMITQKFILSNQDYIQKRL